MLRKLNSASKAGFTLVEIMIVVAIIALLAAIAVPNFMRARKRSQATTVLEELRLIDAAKDQYAIETNKKGGDLPTWADLKPYMKSTSPLVTRDAALPKDVFMSTHKINDIDTPPQVADETITEFGELIATDFWGAYGPTPTP